MSGGGGEQGSSQTTKPQPVQPVKQKWYLPDIWFPLEEFFAPHPQYHQLACECLYELFYGQGALKKCERHYLALMTSAHHNCKFLMNLHLLEFEREGGDPHWMQGLKGNAEPRFHALDEFIHLLSHQPWRVNAEVLKKAMKTEDQVNWSLNQLIHLAVIVATTNSLCALVHGVGKMEPHSVTSSELSSMASRFEWLASKKKGKADNAEIEYLLKRMSSLRKAAEDQKEAEASGSDVGRVESLFIALTTEGEENDSGDSHAHSFTMQGPLAYIDFANRQDNAKTFKIHEFDWDHGYNLIADISPTLAKMLDDKFVLMQNLTYNTMGDYKNVDTSEYRLAIWNYIHALFGIRHDDYDYAQVNELLTRSTKTFVKTAACFPARLTEELRQRVMPDFNSSEKIHVLLILVEARCQANLLYFTRALTNYYVAVQRRRD